MELLAEESLPPVPCRAWQSLLVIRVAVMYMLNNN